MFISQEYENGHIPPSNQIKKIQHFYECVATLMSLQLQNLCLESVEDYSNFICDIGASVSIY